MSARPSDPVAVLADAASLLPRLSRGWCILDGFTDHVRAGRPVSLIVGDLFYYVATPTLYTPDERAAFALAREALGAVEVPR